MDNNEQGTSQNPEETTEQTVANAEDNSTDPTEIDALRQQLEQANTQISDLTGKLKRASKKPEKKEERAETTVEKPGDLDYGQKAYLKAYGIAGSDELSLVKQFQDRGFNLDAIVEDDVFTSKLNSLREAKATTAAIPRGTKRSGETGSTDLDMAVAKYKETGQLPTDFKLRNAVIDKAIVEPTKGPNSIFN